MAAKTILDAGPPPRIGSYSEGPAQCHEYDPCSPAVAAWLSETVRAIVPILRVEHVGSTAVPGCDGKGIIDLLVLYPPDGLEEAKRALAAVGFQRQTSGNPFPEERPMRTASVLFCGIRFRVHAHVIQDGAEEARALVAFRDRLRDDAALLAEYIVRKRAIIAAGITQTGEYSNAKSGFIRGALGRSEDAR
jgi:GrpB-like predicted nucleotidyltransferase (UPF0157 family)